MPGEKPAPVEHPVTDGVGFLAAAGRAVANLFWPGRSARAKGASPKVAGDSEPVGCELEDPATVFSPHPIDD